MATRRPPRRGTRRAVGPGRGAWVRVRVCLVSLGYRPLFYRATTWMLAHKVLLPARRRWSASWSCREARYGCTKASFGFLRATHVDQRGRGDLARRLRRRGPPPRRKQPGAASVAAISSKPSVTTPESDSAIVTEPQVLRRSRLGDAAATADPAGVHAVGAVVDGGAVGRDGSVRKLGTSNAPTKWTRAGVSEADSRPRSGRRRPPWSTRRTGPAHGPHGPTRSGPRRAALGDPRCAAGRDGGQGS